MSNNKDIFVKRYRNTLNIPSQINRVFLIGDVVSLNADLRGIPRGTKGKVTALQSAKGEYAVKFDFGLARSITLDVDPQNITLSDRD